MSPLAETISWHRAHHPDVQAEDAVKLIFQAMLGCGHLLGNKDAVEYRIAQEAAGLSAPLPEEALTEPLSDAWTRLNLRPALSAGLSPAWIAAMMLHSPRFDAAGYTRVDVSHACEEVAAELAWPELAGTAAVLDTNADWLPSHSDAYHAANLPAYRVISTAFLPLLPVLCAIGQASERERLLVTIDGPCAGGKSTLAAALSQVLEAPVVHMDDYYVPHAQKTAARLAQPGGNADWERLVSQVLRPWLSGQEAQLIRYSCQQDCMEAAVPLPACKLLLLEGSYSQLPAISAHAAVRVWVDISPETQQARLLAREGEEGLQSFKKKWIPLEQAYHQAFHLPEERDVRIDGASLQLTAILKEASR